MKEIAVRISHVHAGSGFLSTTLARDRAFLDLSRRPVQHRLQRLRRAIPYEAQVAARRLRGGSPQCERLALPQRRPMKIDHLVANVNRACISVLDHLTAEAAIEGNHRLGILHWKRYMIETMNASGLLGQRAG